MSDALDFDETDVDASELEGPEQPAIFTDKATDEEDGVFDDLFDRLIENCCYAASRSYPHSRRTSATNSGLR